MDHASIMVVGMRRAMSGGERPGAGFLERVQQMLKEGPGIGRRM
jgi:hypothetical protein